MGSSQERPKNINQNYSIEASRSAALQLEKLTNAEVTTELLPKTIEDRTEKARAEAMQTAISIEAKGKNAEKSKDRTSTLRYRGTINNKQREASYNNTLKQVQSELPSSSRTFSKFTHNKFVEKTSDIAANTITRPNAMLSGAISAFVLTLASYTIAKTIGYAMSGFETIAAFIIGWTIGIIFDYLHALITGKKF